jgi:hypothetical protein
LPFLGGATRQRVPDTSTKPHRIQEDYEIARDCPEFS